MEIKQMKKIIAIFIFCVFFAAVFALADGPDFSINFSPQNYGPNDKISITISSKGFDLANSAISWTLGGKNVLKGIGEKKLNIVAPDFGKEEKLIASVISAQGIKKEKTIIINGNGVDLLWKAQTSVPVWYKGKALPVMQSKVKVSAMPFVYLSGKEVDPAVLFYEWFVNNKKDILNSGTGKRNYTFQIKNYDDYVILVKISGIEEKIKMEKGIVISADRIQPKILFYEEKSLEGTQFQTVLGREIELQKTEMGTRAEAYFFSGDGTGFLDYEWTMNGLKKEIKESPDLFFFKKGEASGVSEIKLKIKNSRSLLQSAENFFRVDF